MSQNDTFDQHTGCLLFLEGALEPSPADEVLGSGDQDHSSPDAGMWGF